MIKEVLNKIVVPKPKEIELDSAETLRNKLEKLTGDQRIDWKSIRGLEEEMSKRNVGKAFIGGGVSKMSMDRFILDPYTPTGAVNGSNTDFVLQKSPNPTASLKVYRGGAKQQLNPSGTSDGDYSLSGKTITFNISPLTNEIIECEHRI